MKTAVAAPAPDAPADPIPNLLTKADRCDHGGCPAQAFVRTTSREGLSLDWCGHHYNDRQAALAGAGFEVHDERHRINDRPSPSANKD